MSTTDNDVLLLSTCANCGKEGNNLNTCNKCKLVKYCNAACKKKHRSKHKKKCDRRVAEIHDEALFKQPPPEDEDCPICFLRLPTLESGRRYNACCGKKFCTGCIHAVAMVGDDLLCPFCRTAAPTSDEEAIDRNNKRVEVNDAEAIHNLGCYYYVGMYGLPQNRGKALELYHQSAELGYSTAHYSIGYAYNNGIGVERDGKKAKHYFELAAMGGDVFARFNLGVSEWKKGNMNRSLKHLMIAVGGGHDAPTKMIQQMCKDGDATRDDYAKALTAYQAYLEEIKSDQRDKAAAFSEEYKYYK